MGSMFRSEKMELCQLFLQPEAGYSSIAELGECGVAQFRDLNPDVSAFQRKYVGEVRRSDEMERILRHIESEINREGLKIPECEVSKYPKAPNAREIIDLETTLEKHETEIIDLSKNSVTLKSNYVELVEFKHVLEKAQHIFHEQEEEGFPIEEGTQVIRGRLGYSAGVIPRERFAGFERMLWRISRGNVFLRKLDIEEPLEDPSTGNEVFKTVFVVFFQGEQLKSRVKKVCTGFHATTFPCGSTAEERSEMLRESKTRLEDLKTVLNQTAEQRRRVLVSIAKNLPDWRIKVCKMKAIYHTLNYFNDDVTKKCLIGECWVPANDLQFVKKALVDGSKAVGSTIPSFLQVIPALETPPTFNRSNRFTQGFQNLIDAYGVGTYQEVNPALSTVITFPFLFGIMFGDIGHGLILTVFALFMILREKKIMAKRITDEISSIFFGGRYIILLMGIFSVYTGFVYNDIFSVSFNIFGSSWSTNYNTSTVMTNQFLTLDPATDDYSKEPYPFGLDPVWQFADNKIVFLNTYKMKMSIIIGVIHMIFGLALSVFNHIHFMKKKDILFEFIPKLLFMLLIFFYLVVLMVMKWVMYRADSSDVKFGSHCAPSVLIIFINMMLFKSTESQFKECDGYIYSNQQTIQLVLMMVAILCIPVLLAAKPIYVICFERRMKKKQEPQASTSGLEMHAVDESGSNQAAHHEEEEEPASEVWIHQIIHTIEYILSTISHTASYLRLWALSLAHSQLSEVLWSRVLRIGLQMNSYAGSVALFAIFAIWAFFTMAILVMMEGLSAFLHTLRLHWVEFMTKFYDGLGYAFQPFSFKHIIDESLKGGDE